MARQDNKHLGLCSQCGICADMILIHERVIAIFGNDDSTSFGGSTRPFAFPPMRHSNTAVDGFLLCRRPACGTCASSLEFVTIHHDCYSIFVKECRLDSIVASYWLWLQCAWRKPWRAAQPLYLCGRQHSSCVLQRLAKICGLPEMSSLPRELIEMIRGYSSHSLFWRSFSAIRLASNAKNVPPESLCIVPLSKILSWERDGVLKCTSSSSSSPIIRLTIDSNGIKEVERLSFAPVYSGECSNYDRSIVVHESQLHGVEMQIKGGLLRLKLPQSRQNLPIWNTPAPPELSSCRLHMSGIPSWQHFHAVEADCINGITFFFSQGRFFGAHIHSFEESSAITTYERFSQTRQRSLVWIYLPITKPDRLLALGIRRGASSDINILARTRLAGDVIIGQNIVGKVNDRCLGMSVPLTIIYGEPEEGLPVQFFGAFSRAPSPPALPRPFPLQRTTPNPLGNNSYFSWAPLRGISSTLTFNNSDGLCRGIIFRYQDGGCRSVGQCRLYIDSVVKETHPVALQFRVKLISTRWNLQLHAVQVKFRSHSEEQNTEQGWVWKPLGGFIQFWFTHESSYLTIGN